ncbi:VanZ family protein [Paraclostridium sordellii]|uniref:VanZ family protein n=1 Tax=Paraclostridium sordellii TaxID=1505 RepID=UPI00038687C6|nr:VanZ family protein [Paeniclostridium sordellii]EPZ55845.1 vanZ like family protein [[Clostridium] sordellii VPI 9048] [Paeniclostridium sordellii VPI 9048]CEK38411.1 putative membrane protein [[Clostridium] sordellii] [Paeniclostridium sordellii]
MMHLNFITIVGLTIVVWAIFRLYLAKLRRTLDLTKEGALLILVIYFLILIRLTIFKFSIIMISSPLNSYQYTFLGVDGIINIIPFKETVNILRDGIHNNGIIKGIILNVIYFIPLGFLLPLLFKKINSFLKIILISTITSSLIEIIQLFTIFSVSNIDDVIFNIIGSAIGLICFKLFEKIVKKLNIEQVIEKIRY